MAFIKKSGSSYTVRHGVTGAVISRHKTRKLAEARLKKIHSNSKTKSSNRGKAALKRHNKRK